MRDEVIETSKKERNDTSVICVTEIALHLGDKNESASAVFFSLSEFSSNSMQHFSLKFKSFAIGSHNQVKHLIVCVFHSLVTNQKPQTLEYTIVGIALSSINYANLFDSNQMFNLFISILCTQLRFSCDN